ncbi:MAG TPA: thiamine biosynthesis protein ThiF [Sulfurimonas sp.]|nr:thiamine biosynthesis protein ThiF [Sulfurimonas sp.]
MNHGFDLSSPLVCEGIIGDGCGGGRVFFVEDATLFAYDPQSTSKIELLNDLSGVQAISKKGCIIQLDFKDKVRQLDLSCL